MSATLCGRCMHPMHWHMCAAAVTPTTARISDICYCRNDVEDYAVRAAAPSVEPDCGAPSQGGPCVLPRGHNIGRADIPENHIGHSVRAAAPPVEPGCPECGLVGAHNPRCASRWDVPPPDRVTGLREAAQVVVNEWTLTIAEGGLVTIALQEPIDMLRAALLDEPVPGLDVERLAAEAFDEVMARIVEPWASGPVLAKHGGDFRRALAARLSETPDAD